uniref:RRM domain-containing protein n=1 Tax=Prolemur simus TaxID=1328070 RepID=A0A8C8YSE8_PROSS
MGMGPGGKPIDANHLNKGIGMGNLGPAGMGMEGIGFGINKMGGMEGLFGGGMENMGRFGSGMNMGRINEILSNALKRGEIIAKQGGGGGGGSIPGIERMGLGHGMDRVGSKIEGMGLVMDHMGSVECVGSGIQGMGPLGLDHMPSIIERMGQTIERMGSGVEHMGPAIECLGLSMERMGPAGMGDGLERMGPHGKACQIFVRNLPFDFTWKMLNDKFNKCGHVLYADIKMENEKSKGCGVVKFEPPEVAERACQMMNGMKLSGREIDVRIDRNA